MLETPFGKISILADDRAVAYTAQRYSYTRSPIDGCYRVCIPVNQYSSISCVLDSGDETPVIRNSTGENYLAVEYVCGQTILTLGAEDDHPAFSAQVLPNGIKYAIHAPAGQVVFGIAWAKDHAGQADIRTWLAADPTLDK